MSGLVLPSFTRPNGKVYRPRKGLVATVCCSNDDGDGIIVRGTHDVARAREIARKIWGHTDDDCPESYLCAECYQDGKEQAAIDAEDARQGR